MTMNALHIMVSMTSCRILQDFFAKNNPKKLVKNCVLCFFHLVVSVEPDIMRLSKQIRSELAVRRLVAIDAKLEGVRIAPTNVELYLQIEKNSRGPALSFSNRRQTSNPSIPKEDIYLPRAGLLRLPNNLGGRSRFFLSRYSSRFNLHPAFRLSTFCRTQFNLHLAFTLSTCYRTQFRYQPPLEENDAERHCFY